MMVSLAPLSVEKVILSIERLEFCHFQICRLHIFLCFLGKSNVPCVGISFGVERLYTLLKRKKEASSIRTTATQVFVMSGQKNMLKHRAAILNDLWEAGIPAETSYKVRVTLVFLFLHIFQPNPKLLNDLQSCESRNIPWGIVFGEREIEEGIVLLRSITSREEEKVTRSDLVKVLKEKLAV